MVNRKEIKLTYINVCVYTHTDTHISISNGDEPQVS